MNNNEEHHTAQEEHENNIKGQRKTFETVTAQNSYR